MTTSKQVEEFLGARRVALVGASRSGKKFGNMAARHLRGKGYQVYSIHPEVDTIDGERCYHNLKEIPEPVEDLLVVVRPEQSQKVVREAAEAGIKRIWLQQGAESTEAIEFCRQQGISVIHGECILMFADPTGPHKLHRWIWKLLRKLPT